VYSILPFKQQILNAGVICLFVAFTRDFLKLPQNIFMVASWFNKGRRCQISYTIFEMFANGILGKQNAWL